MNPTRASSADLLCRSAALGETISEGHPRATHVYGPTRRAQRAVDVRRGVRPTGRVGGGHVAAEQGSEIKRRFAFSILDRALGGPPQGFAAPATAALDPDRRVPSKAAIPEGEAPCRSAAETRESLWSLWSARKTDFMRSGGP